MRSLHATLLLGALSATGVLLPVGRVTRAVEGADSHAHRPTNVTAPPSRTNGPAHTDSLILLGDSLLPLIADFNADDSSTRFLVVLSPKCAACVHGAEAVREALLNAGSASVPIFIVWTPMVTGDDEAAARAAMKSIHFRRVRHYYDPENRVGSGLRHDVFPGSVAEMRASVPRDHFIAKPLEQRPPDTPEWDIYMFYDPGIRWRDITPRPSRWVRQLAQFGHPGGKLLSLMWVNSYRDPPKEGDLATQILKLSKPETPPEPR